MKLQAVLEKKDNIILLSLEQAWIISSLQEAIFTYHLYSVNFPKEFVSGALGLTDTCTFLALLTIRT